MSQIRFGIMGCGHIAKRHARHIIDHPEAELVSVFDIDQTSSEAFAREFKCDILDSASDYEELDVISICTPSGQHREDAIQLLQCGFNVLVEKPMALSSRDAHEMIECAERNGKRLFVVKQNRYNPPVSKLKEWIDSEQLGKVDQVVVNCFWNRNAEYYRQSSWKGSKRWDGGVLFNQFSHFVDIVYYLFGELEEANGWMTNSRHQDLIEFEDCGSLSFSLSCGALGSINFSINATGKNMEGSITVFAENATVKIGGKYLNSLEYFESESLTVSGLPQSAPANNYGYYEGSMSNHDKVIDNVVQSLLGREEAMTSAQDGLRVVQMIEKLYEGATQL